MQLFVVDAFTSVPFTGNPAAVCLLDDPVRAADAAWMQDLAAEMNHSETAFVDLSELQRSGEIGLRWFTPTVEVDICGHATLASAHVLLSEGLATPPLAFRTASGVLRADRAGRDAIALDFPIDVPVAGMPDGYFADEFGDALGASVVAVARCRYDVLVEVSEAAEVRELEPDLAVLRAATGRGVIVTAAADGVEDADFVSRFFAPAVGIDEDPVTGSAHCCLAPYWAEKLGKPSLVGAQLSRRGGTVGVEVAGGRVLLRGNAVTITRGELSV
ncbi:PhzF family phenazine biosynthesis protein [Actinomycetospora endophytica]|uniref:PhzF family phenazine biosynthesis protein n=1 Tax=Actinomycetospora endophytica TaxID=2291215 RepID=A0ABS8P5Q9_9PSEU|nr:PhzF family phenazine biosynthesis protein [Actinomycetospora endophytica]MCD2192731.1 PhzF family phenazine biosynthesis protein [Actinomycetospora endophytica]